MQITKEVVSYVAELSRIKLNDEQAEKMKTELGAVIDYMDILSKIDTEGVEPLSHVFAITNVMRKDTIVPSYDRSELLKNAPKRTDETVIVPKTLE